MEGLTAEVVEDVEEVVSGHEGRAKVRMGSAAAQGRWQREQAKKRSNETGGERPAGEFGPEQGPGNGRDCFPASALIRVRRLLWA